MGELRGKHGQRISTGAGSDNVEPSSLSSPASDLAPALAPGRDVMARGQYRELTRRHVSRFMGELFAQFTGLHFHIAWAPTGLRAWTACPLPNGCSVCRRGTGRAPRAEAHCRQCGPTHLARALSADGRGHRFTCHFGVQNFWVPISVRGLTVGVAYLQALAQGPAPGTDGDRARDRRTRIVPPPEFRRAGRLLRLIVQHVQAQDLAELRQADLVKARHALAALEQEQARWQKELGRIVPTLSNTPSAPRPQRHQDRLVQAALDLIHRRYARPVTLKECARALRLNASYLSSLFSRLVGIPFKTYLTELRLEKAKQLMADPTTKICEVAAATGYASENQFRRVFRQATGLAPRSWRGSLQAVQLVALGWSVAVQESLDAFGLLLG